jgi:hypothetical protein
MLGIGKKNPDFMKPDPPTPPTPVNPDDPSDPSSDKNPAVLIGLTSAIIVVTLLICCLLFKRKRKNDLNTPTHFT